MVYILVGRESGCGDWLQNQPEGSGKAKKEARECHMTRRMQHSEEEKNGEVLFFAEEEEKKEEWLTKLEF